MGIWSVIGKVNTVGEGEVGDFEPIPWRDSLRGFLPVAIAVFHMLKFSWRSWMNELDVTGTIHQNSSKHHLQIEVLLENKDDLYYL